VPSTPIYVLATAGMRLLPDDQRIAVLRSTCSFIRSNYQFYLPDCAENVRVITGEEEGLFGWIAVNYLMDGFDAHEHGTDQGSSTYGFLDMGGASTQIAFEPNAVEQVRHADNLVEVNLRLLNGRDVFHPVFVTTWLGFGTSKARDRYVDQEVTRYRREVETSNPVDGSSSHLGSENPVTLIQDPCLPRHLNLAETRYPGYALQGAGDFRACVERTLPLLNKDAKCYDDPCLFDGVHVPPIDFSVNHFIGISDYWYSTQDVWRMGGIYDFVEFEKKALEFCSRDWSDIARDYSEGTHWPGLELSRLEMQCFKAAWIVNVLHDGIGVPRLGLDAGGRGDSVDHTGEAVGKAGEKGFADVPPPFQSLNEVGDVSVSWTLGKMVLEVSRSIERGSTQTELRPKGVFREWPGPGHIPSWNRQNYGFILSNPFIFIGLAVLGLFLWLFFGKRRSRRRHDMGADYILASMEEAGSFSSADSADSILLSSSSSPNSRHSRIPSHPYLLRFVRPFRKLHFRSVAQLRSFLGLKGSTSSFAVEHRGVHPGLRHTLSSPAVMTVHPKGSPTLLSMTSAHAPIPIHPSAILVGRVASATPPPTVPPSRATSPAWGPPGVGGHRPAHNISSEGNNGAVYLSVPSTAPGGMPPNGHVEAVETAGETASSVTSSTSLSRTSSGNNLNAAFRRNGNSNSDNVC
jgi:golgi apyrase